jgi:diphthamide biosynthesis protein 3
MIYSPETIAALARYKLHLGGVWERLEERRKNAIEELMALGDPEVFDTEMEMGGGALDDIKSRYGELAKEVEALKLEVARLEK